MKGGRRVLVVGPNWLGDAVMAMPAVQEWRRRNPEAHLAVLSRRGAAGLWRMHAAPDEVLEWRGKGVREAARLVRAGGWDEAWVMPNSVRSALVPWLGGVPRRVGWRGHWPRAWLLTDARDGGGCGESDTHQSVECMKLFFGAEWAGTPEPPRLAAPEAARARVREWLDGARRPWVAMIPGAARGRSKQWPEERYAEAGRVLSERTGGTAVLLGTPGEVPLCERVRAGAGPGAVSLAGRTTLDELAGALAEADAVLCNDSGGMHLAAALGTPVVAVFGITDPAQTGPLGERVRVLQHSSRRTRAVPRESPEAEAALRAVGVEEAVRAAEELMGAGAGGRPNS